MALVYFLLWGGNTVAAPGGLVVVVVLGCLLVGLCEQLERLFLVLSFALCLLFLCCCLV